MFCVIVNPKVKDINERECTVEDVGDRPEPLRFRRVIQRFSSPPFSKHSHLHMKVVSNDTFGLLIAYIVPGFTALWGLAYVSDTVRSWLGENPVQAPTVAGFLYATLASVAAGVTVSTLRWLILDALHRATGLHWTEWDFSSLQQNVAAFEVLIEIHYRYYQFYGGMMLALVIAYLAGRVSVGFWSAPIGWAELGLVALEAVFLLGSRDTLKKYLAREEMLLGRANGRRVKPGKLGGVS